MKFTLKNIGKTNHEASAAVVGALTNHKLYTKQKMKKTYLRPCVEAWRVEEEPLLAATLTVDSSKGTGRGGVYSVGATTSAMSKEHSFDLFDDDGEE